LKDLIKPFQVSIERRVAYLVNRGIAVTKNRPSFSVE
jgi:hypothetical protein